MDEQTSFSHWQRYAGRTESSLQAYQQAVDAYRQPHRRYHTLRHIESMLRLLDDSGFLCADLFWATWFHDYIYDPALQDNEERSADIAGIVLADLRVAGDDIDAVKNLILATKLHEVGERPERELAFLDADMAILGSPADVYDQYAAHVRSEFSLYPDDLYRAGRVRFVEKTLQSHRIYGSAWFNTRFEQQARLNLSRELERLRMT